MAKKKHPEKHKQPLYKVGDIVSYLFGNGYVNGKIVEDRGCLGVGGRRLYGIRFELYPGDDSYVELPEVELTPGKPEQTMP
jgi:hypothetical protein